MEHECPEYIDKHGGYGEALWPNHIRSEDGTWWAGNGEYGSQIRFCPWCGINLEKIVDVEALSKGQPEGYHADDT